METQKQRKAEFRNLIMKKLELQEEEVDDVLKSTLYSFKKEIEEIGGEDFIKSFMKLKYNKMIIYDKTEINKQEIIEGECIREKNTFDKGFKCICGKKHLKNLHLFKHPKLEKEKLIIGSRCIEQVKLLKKVYEDNEGLKKKFDKILKKLKANEKILTHKNCLKCGELSITKDYEYENENRKHFCSNCIVNKKYIYCYHCNNKTIKIEKDWYGNFKKYCYPCYTSLKK